MGRQLGFFDLDERYAQLSKAGETHQQELEKNISEPKEPKPLIHPNLAEVYRQKVANLHESIQKGEIREEAMEVIRSLIDEIVLTPENGELSIDLKGELAGILTLASGKEKPDAELRTGLAQVKMVAGAGVTSATLP